MSLRFGIAQSYLGGGAKLGDAATDFAAALGESLAEPVLLVTAADYSELYDALVAGRIDFAWMPPMLHARATGEGAELVAVSERDGSFTYRSALLVRVDAPWQRLREARSVRVAWVDPSSAAGYVFPRLEMLGAGVELATERFYGSIGAAADAVLAGEADVCSCHVRGGAGPSKSAAQLDARQFLGPRADRLRVLHVTDSIPPDGLVVGRAVGPAIRTRLRESLLALNLSAQGRAAVHALLGADSLAPVTEHLLRLIQRWAHEAEARAALGRPAGRH